MTEEKKNIVRKPRSKRNYINGVDFQNSLVEFYKNINPNAEIPRYIGECIMKIATKLATKGNFSQYTYKEEMISDAIEKMVEDVRLRKYDVNISTNPLGYYSQISWNAFVQRITKEKGQSQIKMKNLERISLTRDDIPAIAKSVKNLEFNDLEIETFLNGVPSEEDNSKKKSYGYAKHSNLSYKRRKKKESDL